MVAYTFNPNIWEAEEDKVSPDRTTKALSQKRGREKRRKRWRRKRSGRNGNGKNIKDIFASD